MSGPDGGRRGGGAPGVQKQARVLRNNAAQSNVMLPTRILKGWFKNYAVARKHAADTASNMAVSRYTRIVSRC